MPIGFFRLVSALPTTWFDGCAHHPGCGLVVCLLSPGQLRSVLFSALALAMFSNSAQMAWPCDCVWSSLLPGLCQLSASPMLVFSPSVPFSASCAMFCAVQTICQYILHIFCSCQLACVMFGLRLRQFVHQTLCHCILAPVVSPGRMTLCITDCNIILVACALG